jgi:type VI secretion system secreted protein VgrG
LRRRLTIVELQEANLVFGTSLDFDRVWVHEEVAFPNLIGRIGAALARQKSPENNAVTLGNHVYFPVQLKIDHQKIEDLNLQNIGWLIHELTHVWQYQNTGIQYLVKAVRGHIRMGSKVYDYGGKKGLEEAVDRGKRFAQFNPEQQGDIVRSIYVAMKKGALSSTHQVKADQIKAPSRP